MLIFILLAGVVVDLSLLAAGVLPPVLSWITILLCLGCVVRLGYGSGGVDQPLGAFAAALVFFLAFTALPLPSWLGRGIGSERARQNALVQDALERGAAAGLVEKTSPSFALTRNRAGTLRIALLALAGFAAAALSSRLPPEWRERFLAALALIGAVVAAAGYASQWSVPQGKSVWWLFPAPHGRPVGCFVNRNHFGGFVAMLSPVAVALFGESASRRRPASAACWGAISVLMGVCAIMSLSKGAWVAYAVSMSATAILAFSRGNWAPAAAGLAVLVCAVLFAAKLPNEELAKRAESFRDIWKSDSAQSRLSAWRDSSGIFRDYSIVGAGANSFRMVFPQYRSATTRKSFDNAENEYVQTPVELGMIGSLLVCGLLWRVALLWRRNRLAGATSGVVDLAVFGAAVAALTHACFDFALRIPLYFIALCSLAGLVISRSEETRPERKTWSLRRAAIPAMGLAVALAVSSLGQWGGTDVYRMDSSGFVETAGPSDLGQALVWSPTSWQIWYHLGRTALSRPDDDGAEFGEACATVAAYYDPNNYPLWEKLARIRLDIGDKEGASAAYKRLKELRSWKTIPDLDAVEPTR